MARLVVSTLIALLLALPFSAVRSELVGAQGDCTFSPYFSVLSDQIPDVVGQCLEDRHVNPSSGDVEQRTTGGLLVWRKADYRIAFTDGPTTWIHGPEGLVRRPVAGPLFSWEGAPSPTDEERACQMALASHDPWEAYGWDGQKEQLAPIDGRSVVFCIASGGSRAARSPFAQVGVGCLLVGGEFAWIDDRPACGSFLAVERRDLRTVVWSSRGPGVDNVSILTWNGSRFDLTEAYLQCLTQPAMRVELPGECPVP